MTLHIVVPVRDQPQITADLIDQLWNTCDGWDRCHFYDNGSERPTADLLAHLEAEDERFTVTLADGWSIYEMWSHGVARARAEGARIAAVLNNDLRLHPDTFGELARPLLEEENVWLSYPNYDLPLGEGSTRRRWWRPTSGTYRSGGMSGFCFALDLGHVDWEPLVDPGLWCWYGDDDIAAEVAKRGGLQVRVEGLPVEHIGSVTLNAHPEVAAAIGDDRAAFRQKWGPLAL